MGSEIRNFGIFFLVCFGLFLLPAKYLPFEISWVYLIEIVNRNVYICLSASMIIMLFGDWLNGMRDYENAHLEILADRILLTSETRNIELEYNQIKKIYGTVNLTHRLMRPNFVFRMKDNEKHEIRAHADIFNVLTDFLPNKP